MANPSHATLVDAQFGARAAAYVTSAVHAQGPDLERLSAIMRGRNDWRVLDLGCGGGHAAFAAAPHVAAVVAYDLSAEMLAAVSAEAARRGLGNVATRQGRVEALPFADGEFDAVVTRFSAHHWHGFAAALREARRVVRPGGTAVFMDAVAPADALLDTVLQSVELLRDPSHVRDWSIAQWHDALTRAGFAVAATTPGRIRLDFASWVARMNTPALQVQAIRALQGAMAQDVVAHFAIEADGSFMLDTATIEATAA
ncbi:MAG: class I SAM-dependent methyltransferase [Alphaproteobacteria bacterium]|nr:class I SAM-dependent methyltransferase [Alphaproteobacteria bacterium]